MKNSMRTDGYISNNLGDGPNATQSRYAGYDERKITSDYSPPPANHDTAYGTVEDHYGGKKLGMTRTALIFFTNQVGIGILSLPSTMHTLGLIPGIFTIVILMGGLPLQVIVGIANVLNLCLICASANVTLSIGFNTISDHALCTIGFIGLPMIACWLLCMPRSLNFVSILVNVTSENIKLTKH